jgi:predicted Zn-dependent peptidase
MRNTIRGALLGLILVTSAGGQQVQPDVFTLDNGMKFLLLPRTDQPNSIAAGWIAKVGSVNERPGITGISHFFEHMMFKGTTTVGTSDAARDAELTARQNEVRGRIRALHLGPQYERFRAGEIADPWDPANDTDEMRELREQLRGIQDEQREITRKNEFDQIYTRLGGSGMNAFTSHDLTFYFINVPSNKLELWTWMESDRLTDSVFREFFEERDVVHEERRMRTESTPTGIYQEQFDALFWQSSPYSWPVIGWPSDLNSYTREQAEAYYETYYAPNNLCGVVVGDFDLEEAKTLITRYFSRLERREPPPPVITLEMPQLAEKRMTVTCDCPPQVEVRYPSVPFGHADEAAIEMMGEILNGRTGRLYRSLVEDQQLATSAGVRQDSRKYAGAFSFRGECQGEATPELVEAAWYEQLARLQEEPVAPEELQKVKNQILADTYRRLETNFNLLLQLGYYEALGGWEYINTYSKEMAAVEAEDILRVAKEYFAPEKRSVAIYYRNDGAPEDPLAGFPAQIRPMLQQFVEGLPAMTADQLEEALTQLQANRGQAPAEFQGALDFMLEKASARLDELQEGGE